MVGPIIQVPKLCLWRVIKPPAGINKACKFSSPSLLRIGHNDTEVGWIHLPNLSLMPPVHVYFCQLHVGPSVSGPFLESFKVLSVFWNNSDDSIIEMSLLLDWLERTNYIRQKKKKRLRKKIYGRKTIFWKKRRYLGELISLVLILYLSKNFCLYCEAISGTHFIWSRSWSVHSQPQLKIWAHKRGKYWCLIFCYFYPWHDIYLMILCSKL